MNCYICRRPAESDLRGTVYHVTCSRCGAYRLVHPMTVPAYPPQEENWAAISARVRAASDAQADVFITPDTWVQRWLPSRLSTPVDQRLVRLLRLIGGRTNHLFGLVTVHLWDDCALVPAVDALELSFLITELMNDGFLTAPRDSEDDRIGVRLTLKGWRHIQATPGLSDTVFVAMAFSADMDPAYEAIRAAIEDDCTLTAHRVDKRHYPHQITEEIITGLHQCDMVVADVTHARSGVYFEAGYGMALGRPVIFCVRQDRFGDDVHFDTQQYPHIVWADEADLRTKLRERLKGLLARAGRL